MSYGELPIRYVRTFEAGGKSVRSDYYNPPPEPYSYEIYKEGGLIKAKNGRTGQVEFKDTDAATVIQRAIDALPTGGKIFIKNGTYLITKTLDFSSVGRGAVLEGESMYKAILKLADGANVDIIKHDPAEETYFFEIRNLRIYGNRAKNTSGRGIVLGIHLHDVQMDRVFVEETPEACMVTGSFWGYRISKCIFERSNTAEYAVDIRGDSGAFIHCRFGNHPNAKANLLVEARYVDIIACEFETGGEVGLWITTPYVRVIGGYTRDNSQKANNTYPGMRIGAAGNAVVIGHVFRGGNQERFGLEIVTDSPNNVIIGNWFFDHVTAPISDHGINTIIKYNRGYVTENSGTATFSGDGTTTTFTIAHGLVSTPTTYYVEAASADAAGDKYVTADDTNLTVTFATAPPSGTDNVVLKWEAKV